MTPDSLPQPPRRVRGKLGGGLWFIRIFIMPHTLVGIGAAGYLVFLLLWRLFGADIPGTVTGTRVSHSSKHGDSYILNYQFQADGQTKSNSATVSYILYQDYPARSGNNPPVTVHYFSLGPLDHSTLRENGSLWSEIGFLALWAGFWNTVIGAFVYQCWVKPLRTRMLYKHGEAAAGTVLRKRTRTGKSTSYYVTYSFLDPYSGRSIETEMLVWNAVDWQPITEGQAVTVLFSRNNPKRSTVYECGGYRVVDDRCL
jgi:hypothetical protein